MPSVSAKQHRAMEAAAHGSSTIGIPQTVGQDFADADAQAPAAPPKAAPPPVAPPKAAPKRGKGGPQKTAMLARALRGGRR